MVLNDVLVFYIEELVGGCFIMREVLLTSSSSLLQFRPSLMNGWRESVNVCV